MPKIYFTEGESLSYEKMMQETPRQSNSEERKEHENVMQDNKNKHRSTGEFAIGQASKKRKGF